MIKLTVSKYFSSFDGRIQNVCRARPSRVVILFALVSLLGVGLIPKGASIQLVSHSPILIDPTQAYHDWTVGNGVSRGSGTSTNPYVIEGWDIDTSYANGIEIRNTHSYFI